jgi:Ca2+-binding EF-hand superfamily protein
MTFDTDGSGEVDYRELKAAMRALGFDVKKKQVLAILDDYDKDAQSTISAVEFHEICTSSAPDE